MAGGLGRGGEDGSPASPAGNFHGNCDVTRSGRQQQQQRWKGEVTITSTICDCYSARICSLDATATVPGKQDCKKRGVSGPGLTVLVDGTHYKVRKDLLVKNLFS